MTRSAVAVAAVAALLVGCSDQQFAGEDGTCGQGLTQLAVFPVDGGQHVPTATTLRVLAPGGAEGLAVSLVSGGASGGPVGLIAAVTATEYGDVLDLTPSAPLAATTVHTITVADETGAALWEGTFITGEAAEPPAEVTSPASMTVQTVSASARSCCSGPCVEGTVLSVSSPALRHYPQLVLVEVRELYTDTCGATTRPTVTLPAVARDGQPWLTTETDQVLVGCYEASLRLQTGETVDVAGHGCTLGVEWDPLAPEPDCLEVGCRAAHGAPRGDVWAAWLAALAFVATRRQDARRL